MDLGRVIRLAKELADKGELELAPIPDAAAFARLEQSLGRALPESYVRFMKEVGPFGGTAEQSAGVVWSGAHRQLWGPDDAWAKTLQLRAACGHSGAAGKRVNETLYFMSWQRPWKTYGFDLSGAVRVLRHDRPGTMLRVEAASLEDLLSRVFGELLEDMRGETADPEGESSLKVTHDRSEQGPLAKLVKTARAVEHLTLLDVDDGEELSVLAKLPELRSLVHYGDGDLPDALFLAPKLQAIELSRGLTKRYTRGLNGLLKWMREAPIPPKERGFYVRLLRDDPELEKTAPVEALLEGLDCPNETAAKNALRLLGGKLTPPRSLAGAVLALAGRPAGKATALAAQVSKAGGRLEKRVGDDTTHVLVGLAPKGSLDDARKRKLPLVHEAHLRKLLDRSGARHLTTKAARVASAAELRDMLLSRDPANLSLAVTMLEHGGVPDGLVEVLLVVTQHSKTPPTVRKALSALASEKRPSRSSSSRRASRTASSWSGTSKVASAPRSTEHPNRRSRT